jgi:hypothetical protein
MNSTDRKNMIGYNSYKENNKIKLKKSMMWDIDFI